MKTSVLLIKEILACLVLSLVVGSPLWANDPPPTQPILLQVEGITCGSCVGDIKKALLKVDGVASVEFQFKKRWFFFTDYADARVMVTGKEGTLVHDLIQAVESAGNTLGTYQARQMK